MNVGLDRPQLEVDPLIAEAKRRARQRRFLVLGIGVAVTAVAVTGALTLRGRSATPPPGRFDSVPQGARWVRSIDASAGAAWVVDRHGYVWLTMDGGRTWRVSLRTGHWPERVKGKPFRVQSPRVSASLNQVQFVDKRHGWISALLDGGPVSIPPIDTRPWAIERTVDGGRTWRISWLPDCGCGNGELSFFDARHGYVLAADRLGRGNPRLFWTDDGGVSWKLVARPQHYGSITFVDRRNGILGTYPGATSGGPLSGRGSRRTPAVLYRTTDGGKTWSKDGVPPPALSGFWPLPVSSFGRRLVVADGLYVHRPKVYTSSDGGAHWTASALRLPAKVRTSYFAVASPKTWAFVTPGRLYFTHDGGQSWVGIVPRGLPRREAIYQPIVFSSPRVGWALLARDRELYRTTDGGRHWRPAALRDSRS